MIDLHTHSTASDGTYTPRELVQLAKGEGIRVMALTDHDTIDGLSEALATGIAMGVEVIPGVEISVWHNGGEMHILGYYLDLASRELSEGLSELRSFRDQRNPLMVEKFRELGIELTMAEVEAEAGGQVVGRPHFARVLIHKGVVASIEEAFEKYLATGKPAYVQKDRLSPQQGIELIRQAEGIPVLAHPVYLKESASSERLTSLLVELVSYGLQGMEVYYSDHTPEKTQFFRQIADELGLIATGGSDFHGANRPSCRLGLGTGQLQVPDEVLDKLKSYRR